MSDSNTKLKLLDDRLAPIGEDYFHHKIYAQMLMDILETGESGIAIGLFGKWGQGKSTVIDILKDALPNCYRVSVFNAWKSRGDSIRRQLLLNVLQTIDSKQADKLAQFTQTMLPFELWSAEEQRKAHQKKTSVGNFLLTARKMPMSILFCLAVAIISFLVIAISTILLLFQDAPDIARLTACIGAGITFGSPTSTWLIKWWQTENRMLLAYTEPISDSQKLKYPEQFQSIFIEEVKKYCHRYCLNRRLVVIVDDLDRCDPHTIVEALSSIRQFTDTEDMHCQFIVPCDEMQVVMALEADGHNAGEKGARFHDYESEELLRKFFDVVLRMNDIPKSDLEAYAEFQAQDIGLDKKEAREIIGLANPRDPRLVKKLLNALRMSHEYIQKGQDNGLLPPSGDLRHLDRTERLLVVLRETRPDAYRHIINDFSLLDASKMKTNNNGQPLDDWNTLVEDNKLPKKSAEICRDLIKSAGKISQITAYQLYYGKLPEKLRGNPQGGKLLVSFESFNREEFKQAILEMNEDNANRAKSWICDEITLINSATRLKRVLDLLIDYPENDAERQYSADCLELAIAHKHLLTEALGSPFNSSNMATIIRLIPDEKANVVYDCVVNNFVKSQGQSDSELKFLLETCNLFNDPVAQKFRGWLGGTANSSKDNDEVMLRICNCMPEDKSKCKGFAPEMAVIVAGTPQWVNDPEGKLGDRANPLSRSSIITTFVGNSPKHADKCLTAIFDANGQLGTPQDLNNPGIKPAWVAVTVLLSIASDEQIEKSFNHIQNWLESQQQADGVQYILLKIGASAYKLSDEKIAWLSDFLIKRLQAYPSEEYLIDFIGKIPTKSALADGWKKLVIQFFNKTLAHLLGQPALSSDMHKVLAKISEHKWEVAEQAESLLLHKLNDPNVAEFDPWLVALTDLVSNQHQKLLPQVKQCIRNNNRSREALMTGATLFWKHEIDVGNATAIGTFLMKHPDQVPICKEVLERLQSKRGAERILEAMQDGLPEDINLLLQYKDALDMIASGFKRISSSKRASFVDEQITPLISSENPDLKQLGIEIASRVPEIKDALPAKSKKQIQEPDNNTE